MIDKKTHSPVTDNTENLYQIKLKGHLDEHWSDWLGGLEITQDGYGNSLLTGDIPDQAALHGILVQIRDLGLTLISITSQGIEDEKMDEGTDENTKQNS
jgi:hypothetical protein